MQEKGWTIKNSDVKANKNNKGQFIRSEYEIEKNSDNIKDVISFASKYIKIPLNDLIANNNKTIISNHRVCYTITRFPEKNNDFKCEISLDSVSYNERTDIKEYQIEVELISHNNVYQIELNSFVDKFIELFEITHTVEETESKYQKALKALGINI